MSETEDIAPRPGWRLWLWRIGIAGFVAGALAVIWLTNQYLTERFTETTRNRADVRLALYAGNLASELQRNAVVPQLLARDPELIRALSSADFSQTSIRLISLGNEIGAASMMLFDLDGRVVAATDRTRLGASHRGSPYVTEALRSNATVFTSLALPSGAQQFFYSRRIDSNGGPAGVIAVEVDLARLARGWAETQDAVFVTDSAGRVILSTDPRWRGQTEAEIADAAGPDSVVQRAIDATRGWGPSPSAAYVGGEAVLRRETRVPFQGWKMVSFTTYASVRERVNAILALEIMGLAILLALGFWVSSRKATNRLALFQRESAELRRLNARLQREIAEREKVERTLQVAEQSLAQSSKLAVLGEMSAAVSHELNQPLAAMKTYLAGARLLLQRKRPEEALASFQRIDDLIDRMGAITRQLKSYARKGSDAFEPFDARAAISAALAMMEPQLKTRKVTITRTIPSAPVMIMGDRLRLEQVLINLLRNALDATKTTAEPAVEIILAQGDSVSLSVRDNGHGIENLEQLFEPFYTTKGTGEGVGLGLAISSGIVTDMGGRLTARNAPSGGAVFEISLPALRPRQDTNIQAAE